MGVSVVDIAAGMHAYEAILEALIVRGRTGEGADVHVSMFDAVMEWMAIPISTRRTARRPGARGSPTRPWRPTASFTTADGVPS